MSIQPLQPDVIAQINSSITITSLNGVVVELIKNSLDAGASKIDVTVDYGRGGCIVEDNGCGIRPPEFAEKGGLGKLYRKLVVSFSLNTADSTDSSKSINQNSTHGGRGIFLASLSALSLLSVISRHRSHLFHNALSLHKSEVISRQSPCPAQNHLPYDHGTRVVVRDLFGNMPVRVKQRAVIFETQQGTSRLWKSLCRDVAMLLLAWPNPVSTNVRHAGSTNKLIIKGYTGPRMPDEADAIIAKTCSILLQALLITPDDSSSWISVSAKSQQLTLSGTISLRPSATKLVQFLALGIRPIPASEGQLILYDEINRLFTNSAFGNEEELENLDEAEKSRRATDRRYKSDGYTMKELKGSGKGVDRWPMFHINIQEAKSPIGSDVDDMLDNKNNLLSAIIDLLQVMIHEFLKRHYFRPKPIQNRGFRKDTRLPPVKSPPKAPCRPITESPPQSTPTHAAKSSTENHRLASFDLLGNNVKLPSFQSSSSTPQMSFKSWSRIKRGANPSISAKATLINRAEASFENLHGSIDKESTIMTPTEASKMYTYTGGRASAPLVSKTGKLVRRPFSDALHIPRSQSVPPNMAPDTMDSQSTGSNDHLLWINPVTKVRSLINRQTGHVIPPEWHRNALLPTRLTTSRTMPHPKSCSSSWVDSVLKGWDNPIFCPAEAKVPQVSLDGSDIEAQAILHGRHHCSQIDIEHAFNETSAVLNSSISKSALRSADVIAQVDKKFILLKLRTSSAQSPPDDNALLVLVDQHAADERIRIESLMAELCKSSTDEHGSATDSINTRYLDKPVAFEVPRPEAELFNQNAIYFAKWGFTIKASKSTIVTNAPKSGTQQILITSLPPLIAERCRSDIKVLISLLRTEVHVRDNRSNTIPRREDQDERHNQHWLHKIHDCPRGLLDMLNSRACRSAIMFNDELSIEQCQKLVKDLAGCAFPFQCAHGRPSLVPLVDLRMLMHAERNPSMQGADGGDQDGEFRARLKEYASQ